MHFVLICSINKINDIDNEQHRDVLSRDELVYGELSRSYFRARGVFPGLSANMAGRKYDLDLIVCTKR